MQNYFERVEQALAMRRIKKGDLAAHLGVALSTVSRWRDSIPRADTIQATADFLGVPAQWLLSGEAKKKPESEDDAFPKTAINDDAIHYGRHTMEERVARLEAANDELREDLAKVYELLAEKIRKG